PKPLNRVNVGTSSSGILDGGTLGGDIVNLNMTGGSIINEGGHIFGTVSTNPSATTATTSTGTSFNFFNNNTLFNIADGPAAVDMDVAGFLFNGGLIKAGAGTLRLSGPSQN